MVDGRGEEFVEEGVAIGPKDPRARVVVVESAEGVSWVGFGGGAEVPACRLGCRPV